MLGKIHLILRSFCMTMEEIGSNPSFMNARVEWLPPDNRVEWTIDRKGTSKSMIHVKELRSGLDMFKALGSEVRIQILELLVQHQTLNLNDLAQKLNLTNGAVTMHIRKLEECGLIHIVATVGKHGLQKMCHLNEDKLLVELRGKGAGSFYETELGVGHYSNYQALPTCGLATKDRIIGSFDDPRYFADPERMDAGIIWLTEGFLEYRVPNYLKARQAFKEVQFLMEIGSEAPGTADNWPSDIEFSLNGTELGTWTIPGDFGDVRGMFTPAWWPNNVNQYGLLKLVRINEEGCFIDGLRISELTIQELQLDYKSELLLRIAVNERSANKKGLTLYGKHFGNYNHDILVRVLYTERDQ